MQQTKPPRPLTLPRSKSIVSQLWKHLWEPLVRASANCRSACSSLCSCCWCEVQKPYWNESLFFWNMSKMVSRLIMGSEVVSRWSRMKVFRNYKGGVIWDFCGKLGSCLDPTCFLSFCLFPDKLCCWDNGLLLCLRHWKFLCPVVKHHPDLCLHLHKAVCLCPLASQ